MVIPPGYEYVERRRKKLVATGSVMFGVMYGITLMGGIISLLDGDDEYAPMLVPLIGPFLTVGSARHIDGLWTVFFLTDGLVQVAGAALLVTGIAWEEKVLVREKPAKTSLAPELLVGPGSIGMRLRF
jgi:hypothetical protein